MTPKKPDTQSVTPQTTTVPRSNLRVRALVSKSQLFTTFICLMMLAISSYAAPITYTLSGIGSGFVGTTSFTDSAFSISLFADTANVVQVPDPHRTIFSAGASSSSFTVSGIGTGNILTDLRLFVNQNSNAVGISLGPDPNGGDLFDIADPGFGFTTFDLKASLGPLYPESVLLLEFGEPTTLGQFGFTAIPTDVTFTAMTVPEPASVGLFALALLSLMAWKRPNRVLEATAG